MKYKPSRYNYCHSCKDNRLLLYNSYVGTGSFIEVSERKAKLVKEMLKNGSDRMDDITEILIDKGFLVLEGYDEIKLKNFRILEQVTDSMLYLIILPTEQCNFRCKYCYEQFKKGKMEIAIQNSIVKFVQKNIYKYTGLHVGWFGGEPLEALDVIEYLSQSFKNICKMARKSYSASMTTNGYGLSLEVFNRLYDFGICNYQITIDGLKEDHDRQRVLGNGEGTFSTIIENLLRIKDETNYRKTSIIIRTNFTKSIFKHIREYLDFYTQTFGKDKRFNFYIHMASDWGGSNVKAFNQELLAWQQYRDIISEILQYSKMINFDTHLSHLDYQGCTCYASKKNSVVIGSDGTLYKCTGDFEFEQNKVGKITLDGRMDFNENYYLWIGGMCACDKKCDNCYYSACCLSNNCPAVRVRGLNNDVCSFEKEHMGLFLELFDEKLFYKI